MAELVACYIYFMTQTFTVTFSGCPKVLKLTVVTISSFKTKVIVTYFL